MKKYFLLTGIVLLMPLLQSHEFWLQPNKFKLEKGEVFTADIRVGEEYTGELWNYKNSRIVQFTAYNTDGKLDVTPMTKEGGSNAISMQFEKEGLQLLALETNSAFIELEGKAFNAYLIEDGLDDALNYRTANGLLDSSASEFYARSIKTLVQVGNRNDETYSVTVGLPLEISPIQNPYTIENRDTLAFRIDFKGAPLANALVKVWHKVANKVNMVEYRTDMYGVFTTEVDAIGKWMVSAVHMVPSEDVKADWQSYWGSFTFGFE